MSSYGYGGDYVEASGAYFMKMMVMGLFTLLLLSLGADFLVKDRARLLPRAMLRVLAIMPLLVFSHLFFLLAQPHFSLARIVLGELAGAIILGHSILAMVWSTGARSGRPESLPRLALAVLFLFTIFVAWSNRGAFFSSDLIPVEVSASQIYLAALAVLLTVIYGAIQLELFWNRLSRQQQWQYKYLVLGLLLTLATLAWLMSYRLTYRQIRLTHLELAGAFFGVGGFFMFYAVARHHLLNQQVFVSRQIVYSSIAPLGFIIYLLGLGAISVLVQYLGWSLPSIIYWLLVVFGLLGIIALLLSGRVRDSVKFFVSTHFFVNKYEYRDEWLAFSEQLQGKTSTAGVMAALGEILLSALYTETIRIWLWAEDGQLCQVLPALEQERRQVSLPAMAFDFLKEKTYFSLQGTQKNENWQAMARECRPFMERHGLVLLTAMRTADHFVGIIGLGPEFTKGDYGRDDFDLLKALGTQAASAVLAGQSAEMTARLREQTAWQTLSSFVLHDVKNAQAMLSLARNNFHGHIDNKEFQEDLADTIDDALARMAKVQQRLGSLRGEWQPQMTALDLQEELQGITRRLERKLPSLTIILVSHAPIPLESDPSLLATILENILLNSVEAGADQCEIEAHVVAPEQKIKVMVRDNGPGIPPELLPEGLFAPFVSAKENGSGIGLWQARKQAEILGGGLAVTATNTTGCTMELILPTVIV